MDVYYKPHSATVPRGLEPVGKAKPSHLHTSTTPLHGHVPCDKFPLVGRPSVGNLDQHGTQNRGLDARSCASHAPRPPRRDPLTPSHEPSDLTSRATPTSHLSSLTTGVKRVKIQVPRGTVLPAKRRLLVRIGGSITTRREPLDPLSYVSHIRKESPSYPGKS